VFFGCLSLMGVSLNVVAALERPPFRADRWHSVRA
jgi:hypothetical protein